MPSKERIIEDCANLSSGTMATLTGKRKYADLEKIQAKFVAYVKRSSKDFNTWADAWNSYQRKGK